MNELASQKHNFDLAKERLKEFSEKTEAELQIDGVRTDGDFFGIGDHKVTGHELNNRLKHIQDNFIALNETNNKVIREFREIYNTFDVLDKDYIASIVANVKAIEKTSDDVRVQQGTLKQHHEKLARQQSKLDAHQIEIEKNIANISKVIAALKVFQERLEGYKHLSDIDKIWNDCQKWYQEIPSLTRSISKAIASSESNARAINNVEELLKDTSKRFSVSIFDQRECIENIQSFINELERIVHLKDIDDIWASLSSTHDSLEDLRIKLAKVIQNVETQAQDIEKTVAFVESMSQHAHLKDIDVMWNVIDDNGQKLEALRNQSVQIINAVAKSKNDITQLTTYKQELSTITHLKAVDEMWNKVESAGEQLDALHNQSEQTIAEVIKNQSDIAQLTEYKQELSAIIHLKDTDFIWDSTENHSKQIEELLYQSGEMKILIQRNKDFTDQALADEKENMDSILKQFNKKVQYAYWIAGGSMTLALVELLVRLLG